MIKPYNPLELDNLAEDIVRALERSPAFSLENVERFPGAGIYSLYYTGPFAAYSRVSNVDPEHPSTPIYVGRAKSAGARKGGKKPSGTTQDDALFGRLNDHRNSITQAKNLAVSDFVARFLVVDEIWIPLGEQLLLRRYRPVWNVVVDGFGNHNPGGGRYAGRRPLWDELHPGRPWAEKCGSAAKSIEQIVAAIEGHLDERDESSGLHLAVAPHEGDSES